MATMTEVLAKLTEREKAMFYAEQEAAAVVREAEAKVTQGTEDLMELKRTQEQELRVIKAQNEKKIRDASYAWRAKVHKAQKERAMSEALAETSEKRQKRSEAHVANLEQKIYDLQTMIQKRTQGAEKECSNMQRLMDGRFEQVAAQADGRVRSMAQHAKEVCDAAGASRDITAEELHDQVARASVRAEGRTRFKELRELAKSWDHVDLTQDNYNELKGNLIELWHIQSKGENNVPGAKVELVDRTPPPTAPSPLGRAAAVSIFGDSLTGRTPR